jgi:NAD(P)-dependent dehydrogenase (short-subunit alcohol dehydrogenase family)
LATDHHLSFTMSFVDSLPKHWGLQFTPIIHSRAEGPTDPKNNKLSKDFVVVVTGAGKGVGYGMAIAYTQAGASGIVIASRTQSDLDKLEEEIKAINPETMILSQTCDTQQDDQVQELAEATKAKFGRLDVVIANAGVISKYKKDSDGHARIPAGIVEDDDFERVIDINFVGSYRTAKHFVPLLIATRDGPQAYICITSIAGLTTNSNVTSIAYNLSKTVVNRMVENMHNDHNEKDGLQAFSVHPGAVLTPQTEHHHTTQLGELWTNRA